MLITTQQIDELGNVILAAVDEDLAAECAGAIEVRSILSQGLRNLLHTDSALDKLAGFDGDAYEFVIPCGPLGLGYHEYQATVYRYAEEGRGYDRDPAPRVLYNRVGHHARGYRQSACKRGRSDHRAAARRGGCRDRGSI